MRETVEFRTMAWPTSCAMRQEGDLRYLTGRAVVYNQWSVPIYGVFREQIAPGAFDECLARGDDIVCDIDHDMARIIGRTSANTLKLLPDEAGIGVECALSDTSYAKDAAISIERKDIPGMSFIFDVLSEQWGKEDGMQTRVVTKADIFEVSFVFFPAYPATSAKLRSVPHAIPLGGEQRALESLRLHNARLRKQRLRHVDILTWDGK